MLDFLSKAIEWLKSPKRWATLFIVSALLIVLPQSVMQRMRFEEVRERYLPWIGLCALFSFAVLVVECADWLRISIRERRNQKAVLRALTPPEMRVVAEYFRQKTDTQYFSAADGIAAGLVAKGVIYMSASVGEGVIPTFAFNLQPWARNTITKNPSILQVFTVMINRRA